MLVWLTTNAIPRWLGAKQMARTKEQERERDRRRRAEKNPQFLARRRLAWARYAAKPEARIKIKARNKVKHLCRVGKMVRGDCEQCGTPKAHAHHEDYSKPLDVRWLCALCHSAVHHAV